MLTLKGMQMQDAVVARQYIHERQKFDTQAAIWTGVLCCTL